MNFRAGICRNTEKTAQNEWALLIQRRPRHGVLMIIPAYNEGGEYFRNGNSILNYRKKVDFDLDYVVINDGSTDKTKQILEENHFNAVNLDESWNWWCGPDRLQICTRA